jgi:hypothetical protein
MIDWKQLPGLRCITEQSAARARGWGWLIGRALAWPGAGAKLGAFPSLRSGPSNFSKKVLIKKILSLQTFPCPFQEFSGA